MTQSLVKQLEFNFYLDTVELIHALEYYYKAYERIKVFDELDDCYVIKSNLANIYCELNYNVD